jgi:hypothetical protein
VVAPCSARTAAAASGVGERAARRMHRAMPEVPASPSPSTDRRSFRHPSSPTSLHQRHPFRPARQHIHHTLQPPRRRPGTSSASCRRTATISEWIVKQSRRRAA